jgi:amidase
MPNKFSGNTARILARFRAALTLLITAAPWLSAASLTPITIESWQQSKQSCRQRIAAQLEIAQHLDQSLHAVIEFNPEALADAEQQDRQLKRHGPLQCVPIIIKDNIDTHDAMHTSAGSLALATHIAAADAPLVSQLRAAGAIILGKANLSEWANFRGHRSSSGWSGRGGLTLNPHDLTRSACGSSSGSAVAVAAGLSVLAIGTETDGSIICPSSANGIVGVKPTLGLVSRRGIIPIAHSQDTAGPMANSVHDAAWLLQAISAADPQDPAFAGRPKVLSLDFTSGLNADALRGKRIGVVRSTFNFHPGVRAVLEQTLIDLKSAGTIIVDNLEVPNAGKYDDAELTVLLYEFKADLNSYLRTLEPAIGIQTLQDLIAFNKNHADTELQYFAQELFEQAQSKGDLNSREYREALKKSKLLSGPKGIDAALAKSRLDALLVSSGGPTWTIDLVNGDHFGGGASSFAAVSGYPSVTIPAGTVQGLPVGVSFVGPAWSDARILALAYALEQKRQGR